MHILLSLPPVYYKCLCIFYKNAYDNVISDKIYTDGDTQAHNSPLNTAVAPNEKLPKKVFPDKIFPNTALMYGQFPHIPQQKSNSDISRFFRGNCSAWVNTLKKSQN